MLDDVERGRFLVEPSREDPFPALVRLVNVDLHESPRQIFRLPRRRLFAGAQAHDHVLPANRLSGPQGHVLDDSIALVEDSQDRDALRHGSDTALARGRRRGVGRSGCGRVLLLGALAAPGERDCKYQRCSK
jgi:hypothetical protein